VVPFVLLFVLRILVCSLFRGFGLCYVYALTTEKIEKKQRKKKTEETERKEEIKMVEKSDEQAGKIADEKEKN